MLDFIRIACAVPAVRVGDTAKNAEDICAYIEKADAERGKIREKGQGILRVLRHGLASLAGDLPGILR